ncbi:response regulator [Marinospirillum sp.]|uniref:response regulator n=1 Tax=Marinospirillum sp. TaxID=2183934 RepID=UPI00286FE585|nr:response regulator [Marinospirillum sp.]MDR9467240.1 response regulator [Marinospirillum sp.]
MMMNLGDSQFRVLLVEDEPADAHLVRMAFEEGKVLVDLQHVQDGVEALAYLQQQEPFADAVRPDLILLDLNMPRMNGRKFLEKLKELGDLKRIPVVVLTTSEAETDILSSYDLGASGFIVKPVIIEDFFHQVQQLEDYWFSLVKRPQN